MKEETQHWGLAGCGRHGSITADLDEPVDGLASWFLDVRGARWHFRFSVSGADAVRSLLTFVQRESAAPGHAIHEVTKSPSGRVALVKNSDLGVRFAVTV